MKSPLSYAEQQAKRRRYLSAGITFGLYALIFGVGILVGILNPQEQIYANTTILLNLAGPEKQEIGLGSTKPSDKGEETKEPEKPAPVKAEEQSSKIEPPKVKTEEKPAAEKTLPAAPASAKATPSPIPPETQAPAISGSGAPSAPPPPVEPWVPGVRGPGSRVSASSSAVLDPGKGEVPWTGDSVTIRKAEKGSASDTVLGGAQGTVGQNIYNPVYLNLPPPRSVSAALYNNIPDLVMPPNTVIYSAAARKKAFLSYYAFDGSVYRLKSDVPLDQRDPLWGILEDAGYDAAQADYKQGKNLSPVVIGFTVTRDNQLRGVEILQSSGYPDIDGAVLYGFKRGVYWNKTGETVPGRFTYRF